MLLEVCHLYVNNPRVDKRDNPKRECVGASYKQHIAKMFCFEIFLKHKKIILLLLFSSDLKHSIQAFFSLKISFPVDPIVELTGISE